MTCISTHTAMLFHVKRSRFMGCLGFIWLFAVAVVPEVTDLVAVLCGNNVVSGIMDGRANGGKPHGEVDDENDHSAHQSEDVVDNGEDVAAERVGATVLGTGVLTGAVVVNCLLGAGIKLTCRNVFLFLVLFLPCTVLLVVLH